MFVGFPARILNIKEFRKTIKEIAEEEFNFIELSLDYPIPFNIEESKIRSVLKEIKDYGMEIAFHGPWRDLSLASPINEVREASLSYVVKTMEFSSKFNPLYYNIHLFSNQSMRIRSVKEDILKAGIKSVNTLLLKAKNYDLKILIEKNESQCFGTLDWICKIADEIDEVYFTLDLGHLVPAYKLERNSLNELYGLIGDWIRILKNKLLVCHVHDILFSCGSVVDHLAIGNGILNMEDIFDMLFKSHIEYVVFECFRKRVNGKIVEAHPRDLRNWVKRIIERH